MNNSIQMEKNFAKYWINKYCPNILKIYEPKNNEWKRINQKVKNRNNFIKLQNQPYNYELTLFNLLTNIEDDNLSENDKNYTKCYIEYIDKLFDDIHTLLPASDNIKLRRTIINLMENFDVIIPKGNILKSRFKDNLGELQALHKFLISRNFKLKSVENKNESGTSFDLLLTDIQNDKYSIEIVNYTVDLLKWDNEDDLKKFFGYRLDKKIKSKKFTNKDIKNLSHFFLVNLWTNDKFELLVKFKNFFENYNVYDTFNIIFSETVAYKINETKFTFEYASVISLINNYNNAIIKHYT